VINSICAQCHSAEGVSLYPNGAGTWNSREALDLFGGACSGHAKCTDCHEPHTPGPPGGSPDQAKQVAACTRCHDRYVQPRAAEAHSRHGPEVSCLDCHMPRIVQGLDAVIRSHRISSPSDERMLREASPNACNLCHLERSIRWTAQELSKGWRGVEAREDWTPIYGGLDRPLLDVWREHEVPITRLVLTDALARHARPELALPALLDALDDPNPVNRMFASFAIEKVIGRALDETEYSPTAASRTRLRQIARLGKALLSNAER
jgi:hypothetical protein